MRGCVRHPIVFAAAMLLLCGCASLGMVARHIESTTVVEDTAAPLDVQALENWSANHQPRGARVGYTVRF